MLVVLFVAAQAIQRRFSEAGDVFVTGLALDRGFGVRIAQHKLGELVFETTLGVFPVVLAMAFTALLTQIGFVLVVLLMATEAVLGRFLEHGGLVTLFAQHLDVFAEQRKVGLVVVKLGRLFPVLFGVALSAIFAQRFFVLIVFLVTRIALLADFGNHIQLASVAGRALGRAVFAA